jgi:MYXO-CTERM domain-containing protein
VTGYFNIYDATSGNSILKGTASGGAFLRIGGTGSILLSDSMGLSYSFGSELLTLLATTGNFTTGPANPQEGVFTLTDATTLTGGPLISTGGVVNSFSANASYSGNTMTPSPGAIALLGLAGLMVRRRSH